MLWVLLAVLLAVVLLVVSVRRSLSPCQRASERDLMDMVGLEGIAEETFSQEGTVFVRGELWRATSLRGIVQKGERVRVVDVRTGLLLEVEGVKDLKSS